MTESQKHAALIHKIADGWIDCPEKAALLAGAEALEAQGRWRIMGGFDNKRYFVPVDKVSEWDSWFASREVGEYTAIVPAWAEPVQDDVVFTGWER